MAQPAPHPDDPSASEPGAAVFSWRVDYPATGWLGAYSRETFVASRPDDGGETEAAMEGFRTEGNLRFDMRLIISDDGDGGLLGGIQYSIALFDQATMRRMAGHLLTVLSAIAADPSGPVSRLPVLTADERTQLVADWNDTAIAWTAADEVRELIATRAAVAPDAIAVVAGQRCLSYAARSVPLAHDRRDRCGHHQGHARRRRGHRRVRGI